MSEMVDRVAKVLAKADGEADGDVSVMFDYYLELARAAIEAMREPTLEMINAAKWEDGSHTARIVWAEMINEALK